MKKANVVILAGGKGSRMNSDIPKVLHKIAGKPIIVWTFNTLRKLGLDKNAVVVTGYKGELVRQTLADYNYHPKFVQQDQPQGTAHAVTYAIPKLDKNSQTVLVLFGDDSALYKPKTLQDFIQNHQTSKNTMTILTVKQDGPTSLGGLDIGNKGEVLGVLFKSELEVKGIKTVEVACGAFCFKKMWLEENISKARKSNVSGEYTLPSLIYVAKEQGMFAKTYPLPDNREWASVNTKEELKIADKLKMELLKDGKYD